MLAARPLRGGATRSYDVLVLGAGIAGLVTALDLADLDPRRRVAVLDKSTVGRSGSTALAQGGLAAAVGQGDSPQRHAADTLAAGDGLADPRAVAIMTREGPARVDDLLTRGAAFDRDEHGRLALAREGGQSVARSVRAADATGAAILTALRAAARGRVEWLRGMACQLAVGGTDERVCGAWVLLDDVDVGPAGSTQEAGLALVEADAVVLAAGGCGGLYAATTNREDATADGVALAAAAGAELVDLEFVQFHPTGLKTSAATADSSHRPHRRLLLTEALRGAGATLVDAHGRRFLHEYHPDAELAPRHIVTRGMLDQHGGVWLDATALPADVLATEFPTVTAGVRAHGYDLARQVVPVEPCQHYMIGGVATDLWARTSLPGLWAAGEVACTGVHGANRMAGNSLLQSCVFGHRAAVAIHAALQGHRPPRCDPDPPAVGTPPTGDLAALRVELREAMTSGAGPLRSAASLARTGARLDAVDAGLGAHVPALRRDLLELHHMVGVARLIVRSARLRTESRGVHWRTDAPPHHGDWAGVRLRLRSDLPSCAPDVD